MITISNNCIEIRPMSNQTIFINEVLIINTDERKIASIHVHEISRLDKYVKQILNFKKLYGYPFTGSILELITVPSVKSPTTKTITHVLVYSNFSDLKSDFDKLRNMIVSQK